jgi:hypothetical protein
MPDTVASELTLIIPLATLLLTLGWWGWLLHRRGRRSD